MNAKVFLHYDRAALDGEYDNRAKVPAFQSYLDRFAIWSDAARKRYGGERNVAYGTSDAERLDVFAQDNAHGAPISLFIHGGYWKALGKNDFSFVADGLARAGAVVVVVDYALMPSVTLDELVRQCRAALAWTWNNAAAIGGDPDRVYATGHSAGGHLVAMLMATDWPEFDSAMPAQPLRGACGISGLYDLEPIRLSFVNDGMDLTPEDVSRFSPAGLERRCNCPMLVTVGEREGDEYLRQSSALIDAWAGTGGGHWPDAELEVLSDQDHFSIVEQLEFADSTLCRALRVQMQI